MVATLSTLARDALARVDEARGTAALGLWLETATGELAGADAKAVFAGEAAFAAAARITLEAQLPGHEADLARAFPHLYGSPLFSWFEPDPATRSELYEALGQQNLDDPAGLLGWLYQFSIPEDVRSRFGQFYTSAAIVRSMLDGVGFTGDGILESRLIDPACGAGAFLIEATRRVVREAEKEGSPPEVCAAVQKVIHGLDLNPLGVLLTEAAIALILAPYIKQLKGATLEPLHLYVTDTLRREGLAGEAHSAEAEAIKSRSGSYESGFQYVVANPPYAKYPSRLFTPEQAARFARTTYGHPNLYGLFLQVGVELLADGGRLTYINPKSFVSGLYFRNLRSFLTTQLSVERFDTFDKRTGLFDGVLQEVVILTAKKAQRQQATIELREFAGPPDQAPVRAIEADAGSVLLGEELDSAFFVTADHVAHSALAKMLARGTALKRLGFAAVTGTVVWNRLKDHVRDEPSATALPLIWGNGIREFRFLRLGNREGLSTHVELTAKTRPIVSYGEALVVKRMTAKEERRRLVACRVPAELAESEQGYFAENHVNIVRPTGEREVELDAILGLLNSQLFDFIFRALNGNTQVSATELELFPIADGPELAAIAKQARSLTASGGADMKARARMDELVFALYGLDEAEIAAITGTAQFAAAS